MDEAQCTSAPKSCDDFRLEWITKVEHDVSICGEAVCKQPFAGTKFMFSVIRPERLFTDRRGVNNRPVSAALLLKVDDCQKIALRSILITGPGKEVAARCLRRYACRDGKMPGSHKRGDK